MGGKDGFIFVDMQYISVATILKLQTTFGTRLLGFGASDLAHGDKHTWSTRTLQANDRDHEQQTAI
jgi:hypothetical protein